MLVALQGAIGGLLLLILYRFVLPKGNDVDWWTSFAFMLAPPLLLIAVSILLGMLTVNLLFALVCYLLYVLFPLYWFRSVEECGWGRALKSTVIVPVVVALRWISHVPQSIPTHPTRTRALHTLTRVAGVLSVVLLAGCSFSKMVEEGGMLQAYEAFEDGNCRRMLRELENIGMFSDSELSPSLQAEIAYWRGICLEEIGRTADAQGSFKYVAEVHGDTVYGYMAREKLAEYEQLSENGALVNPESGVDGSPTE